MHRLRLEWEARFRDRYDFNPEWWSSARSEEAEDATRKVWLAQQVCTSWKDFNVNGSTTGNLFCGDGATAIAN